MNIDFSKNADGLVPVIVQHADNRDVLMLGYMNDAALAKTVECGRVTFYSRSRQRLWTKGETSGNYLDVKSMIPDCGGDTILIKALPAGPTCHSGSSTCFGEPEASVTGFLKKLESTIDQRYLERPGNSYVAELFNAGMNKIAQKVGEEAVELIIEAKNDDRGKLIGEAADLLFHYLILLRAKNVEYSEVIVELYTRHAGTRTTAQQTSTESRKN